jgi:hypothetical protein
MKDIFLREGMYSVQDLKVSRDQTRYTWDSKRTLQTRRSGFWGVTQFISVNIY